jgi:hypothetical protein
MPESLKWNFSIQTSGGPSLSGSGDVSSDVDTYLKSSVTVPASGNVDVQLLTGAGGPVKLLVIKPAKADTKLTYEANGKDVPLDGPLVLIGAGAASLYGDVGTIKFKNGGSADESVSIFAARDSTP